MQQLLEWSPLIVFFLVFKLFGIYWATGSLMLMCTVVLLAHRWRAGRFKTMHIITVVVALVLGTATLLLHDKRFIQWKPTVLLGLTAAAFLGSTAIGKQPLARRMLEGVFNEPLDISRASWLVINSCGPHGSRCSPPQISTSREILRRASGSTSRYSASPWR